MSSYYDVTSSLTIQLGRVCSNCRSVIIQPLVLNALGRSTFKKKAEAASVTAREKGVQALNVFCKTPFRLTEMREVPDVGWKTLAGYSFDHAQHACPCCGHQELWQLGPRAHVDTYPDHVTGQMIIRNFDPQFNPVILQSMEMRETWKKAKITELLAAAMKRWEENPGLQEQLQAQVQEILANMRALDEQEQGIRANNQSAAARLEQMRQAAKGYSLFSAERKQANADIKEAEKNLRQQETASSQQISAIQQQRNSLRKALTDLQNANPGINGQLQTMPSATCPGMEATRIL